MSDTPRTDAMRNDWSELADDGNWRSPHVYFDEMAKLERENNQLRAQLAEAMKDTERLDWLEENGWRVTLFCWHTDVGKRDNEWTVHPDSSPDETIGRGTFARQAIDAARGATP